MAFLSLFGGERRSLENPNVSMSSVVFNDGVQSNSGATVNEATALGVPAIWQAVNAISGTIAHLPFHLFKTEDGQKEKAKTDPLYRIIHDQTNDVHTSFAFRKWLVSRLLLQGRAYALIVRTKTQKVSSLVPLKVADVTVTEALVNGRLERSYRYKNQIFKAADILDFVVTPTDDGSDHYDPIKINRNAIGSIIAVEAYCATLFANGGVPPLKLQSPVGSPQANERASEQIDASLRYGATSKRKILPMPVGFDLTPIGFDPAQQQMIELKKFQISEVSRIFNIASAMLHDLSTGTYSNVEQQNLNFAQQTISPLVKLIEQEMNAKLFGARNTKNSVEFDLNGLLRGAFAERMSGLATSIQNAIRTPNEVRSLDNLPPLEGGDELMIQGATVPITSAGDAEAVRQAERSRLIDNANDVGQSPDASE